MFQVTQIRQISRKVLFLLGAMLGAVVFFGVYGVKVLDFTNTGWLFFGENDLRQHYIAWCHFRAGQWSFPVGLIETLSYPYSESVIYTDSIPLFAVFFKLFAGVLPVEFQYFGLFGLISFALMGGLSSVLLNRFTDDYIICLIGSLFYILNFQVLHRMFYHTALGAQWIIILATVIWVYDGQIKSLTKKILLWILLGFLCVSIHSYFLAMVGMILAALMIGQFVEKYSLTKNILEAVKVPAVEFAAFAVSGLVTLFVLGGFYGQANVSGAGIGTFSANLNTFVNSMGFGAVLPELPVFFDFQYEGFGYLGIGIILLFVVIFLGLAFRRARKVPEEAFHSNKLYGRMTIFVLAVSFLAAVFPIVTFSDKEIIHIPYPGMVERVLGIFRSNGRLIWPAVYILVTMAISACAYTFRRYRGVAIAVIGIAAICQIADASKMIRQCQEHYSKDYVLDTFWESEEFASFAEGKNQFIFLYPDNDITLESAYYGYHHRMKQNNYYYARDIEEVVEKEIDTYSRELEEGIIRDDAIYVLTEEMCVNNRSFYESLNGDYLFGYGHVFMKSK